jgi:uncharacterized protein YdcH (DUF465 family)
MGKPLRAIHEKDYHMSHVPHELGEEFPEYTKRIHELKIGDNHFRRLFEDYHAINREIHQAEAAGLNISDDHIDVLRKKRLALKDEIFTMLRE